MKKGWIIPLFILWVLAAGQIVQGRMMEEERVAEVFANVGSFDQTTVVEYYGVYKDDFLMLEEREELLHKIALQLGVVDNLKTTRKYEENREETQLYKEGKMAKSSFRFITVTDDAGQVVQYMIINLTMQSGMEDGLGYRKKLDRLMTEYCRESRSSANIIGSYKGELSMDERDRITDALLAELGAKVVSENREKQLYTVYGYTPWLGEYEMQGDQAVNINVAMYYSRAKNRTYVYAAIPILGLDY